MSTDKKKKKLNFPGGRNPLLGGVTFNAHFRTQMSYSSQKSCVKIWFRLVQIGGMQNFGWGGGGGRSPLFVGSHVTGDAHFRTWPSCFS